MKQLKSYHLVYPLVLHRKLKRLAVRLNTTVKDLIMRALEKEYK